MTLSTLQMGDVHESVEHLPKRIGAFDIPVDERTDAKGRPIHRWDEEKQYWAPIEYGD
jgi:hypothetical protein